MESRAYDICLEKYEKTGYQDQSWDELADMLGYENGEQLRSQFRRVHKKVVIETSDEDNDTDNSEEEFYDSKEKTTYEESSDFINVVCASPRILSKEDIIKQFNIDTDIWEVERFKCKTSEGYRKDRQVSWHVKDGNVTQGDVEDTGKMLVVPLYHVEVRLVKKKREERGKDALSEMLEEAKSFSPKYSKIEYRKLKNGNLYEIDIPDIHHGRLAWGEETGLDYDIQLSEKAVNSVIDKLLSRASNYEIDRILLPIGNDFFNVDNKSNTTSHGTPQQEDTRWKKTFRSGWKLLVEVIDKCSSVAPVDVIVVPGNHDEERSFYLGEVLDCWYHNSPNVSVNNSAMPRKYYLYGKNMIGFTHGYYEKLDSLPLTMAVEEPKMWAESLFREIHVGDKHHKQDTIYSAKEGNGVVVRILRSLAVADAWTFNKGFVGAVRAAEAFLWNKEEGLVGQFTATPEI